ncbi:MAG: hypothetical protein DMF41_08135 [Verrucomicrobia bacterium]|nr:MAG: hypothetical protein DMF41_08135 [Verrucomicrobiota bacterium]
MKLNYFPDTDSLYIDLSHRPSVESQEVSEGVVLDYDSEGNLILPVIAPSRWRTLHRLRLRINHLTAEPITAGRGFPKTGAATEF